MKRLPFLLAALIVFFTHQANAQRYRGFRDNDVTHFRIGLHGGWSYMIAKVSDDVPADFRSYVKELKSGYHYGGNAIYFFNSSLGVGIEYSGFRTANEMDNVWAMDTVTKAVRTGKMRDDITISFIGPSFSSRFITGANDNFHIISSISLGYLSYKNKAVLFDAYTLTSGTVGLGLTIGFDFKVEENIFLGAGLNYLSGSLSYYDYKDANSSERIELPEDNREGISRIDVSAGVRFNF